MKYKKPGPKKTKEKAKRKSTVAGYKQLTKKERLVVYKRYSGHCAYCGREIEYSEMQADHKIPKRKLIKTRTPDWIENYMPSCRRCNHYKRDYSLNQFRRLLMTIQGRISKDNLVKVAIDYKVIKFHPFDGEFYFEKFRRGLIDDNKNGAE